MIALREPFHLRDDRPRLHVEDFGEMENTRQRRRVFSPFETAEICGIHIRFSSELNERPSLLRAQASDDRTEACGVSIEVWSWRHGMPMDLVNSTAHRTRTFHGPPECDVRSHSNAHGPRECDPASHSCVPRRSLMRCPIALECPWAAGGGPASRIRMPMGRLNALAGPRSSAHGSHLGLELAPSRIEPIDFGLRGGELGEALLERRRVGCDRRILGPAARLAHARFRCLDRLLDRLVFALLQIREPLLPNVLLTGARGAG